MLVHQWRLERAKQTNFLLHSIATTGRIGTIFMQVLPIFLLAQPNNQEDPLLKLKTKTIKMF